MDRIDLSNPAFAAYAIAASLMILKTVLMAWATVLRMMQVKGGYRAPEDARATPLNPTPRPGQTDPDERVERFRRIHQNDLENVPLFLVAGFLFLFTDPDPRLATAIYYGYALSRLLHFWAYATAKSHDLRAAFWTVGVLLIMGMSAHVLATAIGVW